MLSQTQKALDKCLLNYIWIKFKYSSQACAQLGNAGADPAAKTRRLFLNRNLGQLCISKKIRDIARCSQYKHQRLDGSQRTWEIICLFSQWYNLSVASFSKWEMQNEQFLRYHSFCHGKKAILCNRAKENRNHDIWTMQSKTTYIPTMTGEDEAKIT